MSNTDPIYYLSENDRELLKTALRAVSNHRINTAVRSEQAQNEIQTPDVYISYTPSGGIPALISSSGDYIIQSAECAVYNAILDGSDEKLQSINSTQFVYNLGASDVPGSTWILIAKDKSGKWIAIDSEGGGSGITGITARKNTTGTVYGPYPQLDFIEGTNIGLSLANSVPNNEIQLTITNKGITSRKDSGTAIGPRTQLNFKTGNLINLSLADDGGATPPEMDLTIDNAGLNFQRNTGTNYGPRRKLNLIEGSSLVGITMADDGANDRVNATFNINPGSPSLFLTQSGDYKVLGYDIAGTDAIRWRDDPQTVTARVRSQSYVGVPNGDPSAAGGIDGFLNFANTGTAFTTGLAASLGATENHYVRLPPARSGATRRFLQATTIGAQNTNSNWVGLTAKTYLLGSPLEAITSPVADWDTIAAASDLFVFRAGVDSSQTIPVLDLKEGPDYAVIGQRPGVRPAWDTDPQVLSLTLGIAATNRGVLYFNNANNTKSFSVGSAITPTDTQNLQLPGFLPGAINRVLMVSSLPGGGVIQSVWRGFTIQGHTVVVGTDPTASSLADWYTLNIADDLFRIRNNNSSGEPILDLGGGSSGQLIYQPTGGGRPKWAGLTSTGGTVAITPGVGGLNLEVASPGGTVTSVSASTPTPLTVTVGTSTTTPALLFTWTNTFANTFLAGPTSGAAVPPTMRAIVAADLPSGMTAIPSGSAGGDLAGTYPNPTIKSSVSLTGVPLAPTASPGTNTTQIASTAFVSAAVTAAVAGLLNFKGTTDCSANPNYPSAVKGDAYIVSVAGKIGGASGTSVDVGDWYVATATNAGGTEASVGASWGHMEHNLVGALLASNNLSDLTSASSARSNLGLGTLAVQNGTFSGTSSGTNTGDQTITLTGGVTGSGTGSFAVTVITNANLTGPITSSGNTTSINLQTGTGSKFVMDTAPTIVGGLHTAITTLGIRSTGAAFDITFATSEVLTAGRTLSIVMGDTARTLTFTGNATISGTTSGTNTGDQTSVSGNAGTATALATGRTIAMTGDVAWTSPSFDGSGNVTAASTIGANKVTLAMLATVATATFHGRTTAGTGNVESLTVAQAKALLVDDIITLQDQKTQNTGGGTFTLGAWRTRTLNTKVQDTGSNCTLSSNQFTLTAGTYEIWASAPAWSVSRHQTRLQNVTDSTTVLTGTVEYAPLGSGQDTPSTRSWIIDRFTIAASKALEIQHWSIATSATVGFGVAGNITTEVYTQVFLRRIA